jgi:hypothetical protein
MGTRADFYVGRGENAEWLGSIAMDGYPDGNPCDIIKAETEAGYRKLVAELSESCRHFTKPEQGWPWPWDDGKLTDYSYAFDEGHVWGTSFGYGWWDARAEEPDGEEMPVVKTVVFPNMAERQNVVFGDRSGLMILTGPKI